MPAAAWSPWLVFGGLALLALLLRLACFTGLIGSDDLFYAHYARALMEGEYGQAIDDARGVVRFHWALRYGLLIPLAAIYKTFGVSEWTTIVLPLVSSTASVLLLVEIGRRLFDIRAGILAGLLYATFPMQLRLGTVLLPEPIAEFFALAGVLCYVLARERGGMRWIVVGVLMGVAYLAKEPALFVGGAFFLHAAWERRWRGAALFACGMATILALEHAYYVFGQGDLLFRLHSTRLYNLEAPDNQITSLDPELFYDLFVKYPSLMLVPNATFGLHSVACIAWSAAALTFRPRRSYVLVLFWAVIPWLYLNFGSWSLEQYAPLPRGPRYIEFTYPPLMLLSGVLLARALSAARRVRIPMAALLAVVVGTGLAAGVAGRGQTARAEEMTVLREIVRATRAIPGQTLYTENDQWRMALQVFDASLLADAPDRATFVLVDDPFELPLARRVATPETTDSP